MTTDTPKNIFEAAGKSEKDRRKAFSEKTSLPNPEATLTTSVSKMLEHCRDLHENISSSLNQIFTSKGITHTQYKKYVSTQRNFSNRDWEIIETTRKNTEIQLEKLAIISKPKEIEKTIAVPETKEKPPQTRSEPKRKPVTRRQWLQMH